MGEGIRTTDDERRSWERGPLKSRDFGPGNAAIFFVHNDKISVYIGRQTCYSILTKAAMVSRYCS